MEEFADLHCHLSGSILSTTFSVADTMPLNDYLEAPFRDVEQRHGDPELFHSDLITLAGSIKHYTEIRFNALRRVRAGLSPRDMANAMSDAMSLNNQLRFIMTMSREDGVEQYGDAYRVVESAPFCGVDLAGREIPELHELNPTWLHETVMFFRDVSQLVGVTYHVGETGSFESINRVVRALGKIRIGHGLGLISAPDAFYQDHRFMVEVCPTANLKTMTATREMLATHVRRLMWHRVPFCYNTDSPRFLQTDIVLEHILGEKLVQHSAAYSRRSTKFMRFTNYRDEQSA